MKRIMTPRAAAVAFAASALVATPALADPGKGYQNDHGKRHTSTAVQFDIGNGLAITLASQDWAHGSHRRYSPYGYRTAGPPDRYRTMQLRREAVRLCAQAVRARSYRNGFRHVELEDVERIQQFGPAGFTVRAEFEFEGYRRDFDKDVTCTVRRGSVVDIYDLPRPPGHHSSARGHRDHDYRDYGYRNTDTPRGSDNRHRGY